MNCTVPSVDSTSRQEFGLFKKKEIDDDECAHIFLKIKEKEIVVAFEGIA